MGKKYDAALKLIDREKRYTVTEACELLGSAGRSLTA
jgi:hypothetical protein